MSTTQTILLAAIAGSTIFLGLPLGRIPFASQRSRAFLNALSAGILVFLLVDILGHATEPVEEAMTEAKAGETAWSHFAGLALVYTLGFGVGLLHTHSGGMLRPPSKLPQQPIPAQQEDLNNIGQRIHTRTHRQRRLSGEENETPSYQGRGARQERRQGHT